VIAWIAGANLRYRFFRVLDYAPIRCRFYDILDFFMLLRFCPFVVFWSSYLWMYVDIMTCIF